MGVTGSGGRCRVARETSGEMRIPPIWHKLSKDEVARYSVPLAEHI
jgi:hypothetical protein